MKKKKRTVRVSEIPPRGGPGYLVTPAAIKRLAKRVTGFSRVSTDTIESVNSLIDDYLEDLLKKTSIIAEGARKKTVDDANIRHVLNSMGTPVVGDPVIPTVEVGGKSVRAIPMSVITNYIKWGTELKWTSNAKTVLLIALIDYLSKLFGKAGLMQQHKERKTITKKSIDVAALICD